jgi:TonB family protein
VGTSSAVPKFTEISAPRNWNRLGASALLHLAAILFIVELAVLIPHETAQVVARNQDSIALIAPNLEKLVPVKPPPPKALAPLREQPKPLVRISAPKIEVPALKPPVPEAPKLAANIATPVLPKLPTPEKKIVAQGLFDSGSSAKPTIKAPAQAVQTGGFGDPNGVAGKSDKERNMTVASVGSFDMPSGPGNGNGAAGAHGKQAVIASAGFSSGTVDEASSDRSPRRSVSTAGFGDATTPQIAAKRATHTPDATPMEILFKPRPLYTAEARQLHIEGEVLLDIMFAASGQIRVIRVVRGLGHGLDESAERAAQQIRFNPAKKDGQPYDSDAVVHIVFAVAE